jgi:hypothetical protein
MGWLTLFLRIKIAFLLLPEIPLHTSAHTQNRNCTLLDIFTFVGLATSLSLLVFKDNDQSLISKENLTSLAILDFPKGESSYSTSKETSYWLPLP